MKPRWIAAIFAIAFLAAVIGAFIGRAWFATAGPKETELHMLLHDQLDLDAAQEARLTRIEDQFAVKRRALELELHAHNAMLARAIETEHGNGPLVEAAVDRSHRTMGALQKETLAHIFAMRQVLRPDQAVKFDRVVVKALTADRK